MALLSQTRVPLHRAAQLAWLCAAFGVLFAPAYAARPTAGPQQVQALFLLNLARFVKWPAEAFNSPTAPFVIGVTDSGSLLGTLRIVTRDEELGGRAIVCRTVRSPGDLAECHLVFIASEALPTLASRLPELETSHVLLVSDAEGFLLLGGHVQFVNRAGRIRLRLAPDNLRRAELHASAQLLRVADAPALSRSRR